MATRAERQEYLEGLDETEWASLAQRLDDVALDKSCDERIRRLLDAADAADRAVYGDEYDRAFRLPTNAEQQRELQPKAVRASTSSAHAAWFSAGCALVAIIVAVIALVVALGE